MAKFQIQLASSTVNWTGKKVLGLHTGSIRVESGFLELTGGSITSGEIIIDMTSIVVTDIDNPKTHNEFLAHLLHEDFFSVSRFKTAKLVVTGSTQTGDTTFTVRGDLTIKEITHPVSFPAKVEVFTHYLHAMGELVVDRTLYNIRYGSGKFIPNLGDKLIYDDFVLQFKLIGQTS